VCLAQWPLEASLYDGDIAAGPIPTLFAEDIEAATENVSANPATAHADVQRMARVFFMPETLSKAEAVQLVKKPR
jgi:hypothetical protein